MIKDNIFSLLRGALDIFRLGQVIKVGIPGRKTLNRHIKCYLK